MSAENMPDAESVARDMYRAELISHGYSAPMIEKIMAGEADTSAVHLDLVMWAERGASAMQEALAAHLAAGAEPVGTCTEGGVLWHKNFLENWPSAGTLLYATPPAPAVKVKALSVDDLAQEIRRADMHDGPLGAGALAEALMPFIRSALVEDAGAFDPATSPGMTDMMLPPETLDAFMEANPLPAPEPTPGFDPLFGPLIEGDFNGPHGGIPCRAGLDVEDDTAPSAALNLHDCYRREQAAKSPAPAPEPAGGEAVDWDCVREFIYGRAETLRDQIPRQIFWALADDMSRKFRGVSATEPSEEPARDPLVERLTNGSIVEGVDPRLEEAATRITSDAATIASLREEVADLERHRDMFRRERNLAEAERDALKAEVARKDAAVSGLRAQHLTHIFNCGHNFGHDCDCGVDDIRAALAPIPATEG